MSAAELSSWSGGWTRPHGRTRSDGLTWLATVAVSAAVLLGAGPAHALTYFDGPGGWGFDNGQEGLEPGWEIPGGTEFIPAGTNDPSYDLVLMVDEEIFDTADTIDRIVTWTIVSQRPDLMDDILLFFTATGSGGDYADLSGAHIDIEADFEIISYGQYTFAGFLIDDLNSWGERGMTFTTRSFRYTVDQGLGPGEIPALGVAAATNFLPIPEPSTALLVSLGGVGILAARSRRRA